MRSRFIITFVFALAACACAALAQEQGPEDEVVRGAFVTTRPGAKKEAAKPAEAASAPAPSKATQPSAKSAAAKAASSTANRRRAAGAKSGKTGAQVAAKRPEAGGTSGAQEAAAAGVVAPGVRGSKPAGIGLGYTLFMRDEAGGAVRVSPSREFKSGESIRLLVESNTDGYLYVFNAEGEATPQLIFPDARLNRGDNRIGAHVPYEIPSGKEADERLRWFVFNDSPASERVFVVVAREPLEGVPTGEELVKLCAESGRACAWQPTGEQWALLKAANARDRIAFSQLRDAGRAETKAEREAATRGIGLAPDAPLPSVIYMIASSNANVLVAAVELIHK